MVRVRRFEERCVELYSGAQIRGFLHLYIGEEAVAVGVMHALAARRRDRRDVPRARARARPRRAGAGDHGRDVRQGRRLQRRPRRLDAPLRRRATASTAATRSSAAASRSRSGSRSPRRCRDADGVVACFFGEGAIAEGEFHECMNLAALWQLPCCSAARTTSTRWAPRSRRSESETDLSLKASSYEMPAWPVDGMDVARGARRGDAARSTRCATAPARTSSSCARIASARTRCTTPSSTATRPRSRSGRSAIRSRRSSRRAGSNTADVDAIEADAKAEIDDAVAFAEQGTDEPVADLTRFVTSELGRT